MLLRIKVKPSSKADEIIREADGSFKIKIKAPPIDGKANKHLIEFLSGVLQIPKSKIEVLKGGTSQFKTLQIDMDEKLAVKLITQKAGLA